MLLVNIFQVTGFIFLILEEILSIFFPNLSLFLIDFFLLYLFGFFLLNLSCKILSHLFLLFLLFSGSSLFIFFLFFQLIFNMPDHFLILKSDLFFLILDDWISKWGHNLFDFLLPFFFFLLSFSLKLILEPGILLLHSNILRLKN